MRVVLAILIALGISHAITFSALAADKKKTVQQKTQAKKIWAQEPKSFLGVKFDEPITSSVPDECPKNVFQGVVQEGYADLDKVKAFPEGTYCYLISSSFPKGVTANIRVMPHVVPPFSEPYVSTYGEASNGNVARVTSVFETKDFSEVKRILITKYGSPKKESLNKVKTNGGQEFDNHVLDWEGAKVSIHVESLVIRYVSSGLGLQENGFVWVTTNEFSKNNSAASDAATQDAASKL